MMESYWPSIAKKPTGVPGPDEFKKELLGINRNQAKTSWSEVLV
jgi:hypothetical protein